LSFPIDETLIPFQGVYFLFEEGESGHDGERIVRIGTHTGSGTTLADRLREHFLTANKDRSIFRKNIGRALLNRDQDSFLADWNLDLTTSAAKAKYAGKIDLAKQLDVESRVTQQIHSAFRVAVLECTSDIRRELEANLISTVAACTECRPSMSWLGLDSPVSVIRQYGLWQVQGVKRTAPSTWTLVALNAAFAGRSFS
jgi:hypothetical protein